MSDSRTPMLITTGAVALNMVLAFLRVLGPGPLPKFGVAGAAIATLISQTARAIVLLFFLYNGKRRVQWIWPSSKVEKLARPLFELTYPIAISELLWGTSSFVYAIVFARLGTKPLVASQISVS